MESSFQKEPTRWEIEDMVFESVIQARKLQDKYAVTGQAKMEQ